MERRRFIGALAAAPFLACLGSSMAEAAFGATQNSSQGGMPPYTPQFPGNEPPAPGQWPPDNSPQFPQMRIDPHAILMRNQKNIQKDVARLYDLAGKLRKQVDDTDSSQVLSIDMIHTADEIEKLAKHIKDLAKG